MAETTEGFYFSQTGEALQGMFTKLLAFLSGGTLSGGASLAVTTEVSAGTHKLTEKADKSTVTALGTQVTNETTARENADKTLETLIDTKMSSLTTGKFYGHYTSADELPTITEKGFAYVVDGSNYKIYDTKEDVWAYSGVEIDNSVTEDLINRVKNAETAAEEAAASASDVSAQVANAQKSADDAEAEAQEAAASLAEYKALCDKLVDESGEITADAVLAQVNKNTATLKYFAGTDSIETFSETKKYVMNDLVVYNQKMYRFKTVHLAGAWSDDDVEVTDMYTELEKLRDQDYENVYVTLSTADGNAEADLGNITVTFKVYDDEGTLTDTITRQTNEYGVCDAVSIPYGSYYKISYDDLEGYMPLADNTFSASKGKRNVYRYYGISVDTETEHLTVTLKKYTNNGATITALTGQTVKITIDDVTTSYTTDSSGSVSIYIPIGKTYDLVLPTVDGNYLFENKYEYNETAAQESRVIIGKYSEYETGVFIVTKDGKQYTFDDFKAQSIDITTARVIKIATEALCQQGAVFGIGIDEIRGRVNFPSLQWNSTNTQFNSVGNGYHYTGYNNCLLLQAEGVERGLNTPAIDNALSKSLALDNDTLNGFLGAVYQWMTLWDLRSEVDEILAYTRPADESGKFYNQITGSTATAYTISSFTSNKWTSCQGTAVYAYSFASVVSSGQKHDSYVVVPFYAF